MEKNDKKEIDFDKEMDLYLNYLRLDIVKKKLAEMFEMKIEMQDLKEYSLKLTKEKILNYGLSLDQVPEDMLRSFLTSELRSHNFCSVVLPLSNISMPSNSSILNC